MNSFFAAIGMLHEDRSDRINRAIDTLLSDLKRTGRGVDVINLNEYKQIREEVADPKLFNVGFATESY